MRYGCTKKVNHCVSIKLDTFVSICDEMPDGLKKQVVGHSRNMDTNGIYGHRKTGDLERAAAYSDAAFRAIL